VCVHSKTLLFVVCIFLFSPETKFLDTPTTMLSGLSGLESLPPYLYVSNCCKGYYSPSEMYVTSPFQRKPLGNSNIDNCLRNLTIQPGCSFSFASPTPSQPQLLDQFSIPRLKLLDSRVACYSEPRHPRKESLVNINTKLVLIQDDIPETDEHKINQRAKQIGYGKSTAGYANYVRLVPKDKREPGNDSHPVTPRVDERLSKRNWDGKLKQWRRSLHKWDNPEDYSDMGLSGSDPILVKAEFDSPSSSCGSLSSESLTSESEMLCPPKKLVFDEPHIRSWASECSDTEDYSDLSGFTLD